MITETTPAGSISQHLYLIPGLGADSRLFSKLELPGVIIHHISWVEPLKNESLAAYAKRMCEQVDTSRPFSLGGVSFGSLLAVEMAKWFRPEKIIIISGIKQKSEISALGALLRILPVYYIAPKYLLRNLDMPLRFFFGARNTEELQLLKSMLDNTSKSFINWALHEIIHWKNQEQFPKLLHMAGTRDRLMFGTKISHCHYLEGGTHLMVLQEAQIISKLMMEHLKKED